MTEYLEKLKIYFKSCFITDLLCDIIGGVIYSTAIYTFASNADFAPGGVSGLALIINHYIAIPIGLLTLIVNIPLILISFKYLGIGFLLRSVKSMMIFSFIVDVIFPHFPRYSGNPVLAAIFCGAFGGIGLSFLYRRGSSSGGTDFLTLTLRKLRPHWSIGSIMLCMDAAVIFTGGFVFGRVDSVLHGIICTAVGSTVLDKILASAKSGKLMTVISDKCGEIERKLADGIRLESVDVFSGKEGKAMLLCGCKNSQFRKVCYIVYDTDENAVTYIQDYNEAYGRGLLPPDRNEFIIPYPPCAKPPKTV